MFNMNYSCVIIGLGAIGMGYDYEKKNQFLTHASAITAHPNFDLVSAVDPSPERRALFEIKYRVNAYKCIQDLPQDQNIDVFIVCTPTHLHLSNITEVLDKFSPLCILCEKPISNNFLEADSFFANLQKFPNPKIFVNYMRRSDESSHIISKLIHDQDDDFEVKGHCYYTKGALNNASHFLNLLESWFGSSTLIPLSSYYPCEVEGDFNLDFMAKFRQASIVFQSGVEDIYSLYQFQLYLSSGILSYSNCGKDIFYLPKEYIADCPTPYCKPWISIDSRYTKYQYYVYDELLKALSGQPSMLSTKTDALSTLKSLSNLRPL